MDPDTNNFISDSEKKAGCDGEDIQESRIITSAQECDIELDTEVELRVSFSLNSTVCFIFITHITQWIFYTYEF